MENFIEHRKLATKRKVLHNIKEHQKNVKRY